MNTTGGLAYKIVWLPGGGWSAALACGLLGTILSLTLLCCSWTGSKQVQPGERIMSILRNKPGTMVIDDRLPKCPIRPVLSSRSGLTPAMLPDFLQVSLPIDGPTKLGPD